MEQEKEKKQNKVLKICYLILFWIISVLGVLFSFVALLAEEYLGGFIVLLGSIGINPLFHKISIKKERLFNHMRRIISVILIILGFFITLKLSGNFYIRNNALDNSHEDIISVLNNRLSNSGEKINKFVEVEANDIGRENNYKIYEYKVKNNLAIQLIEKNERIEAIRTYSVIENDYDISEEDSSNTAGLIMGIIMNECGVNSEEGNIIVQELEKNNYNAEIERKNFTLVMKTTNYYVEMIMIYNMPKVKLIREINSNDITNKINTIEEELKIEEIDKNLESIKNKVENESISIYDLKQADQILDTYEREIKSINITIEEYKMKKDIWDSIIQELKVKVDEKLKVTIPDFNTMSSSEAENWGKENKITVTATTEYSDTVPKGSVISQTIKAGERVVKEDNTVKIVYSIGKKPTTGELNALKNAQYYSDNLHMSKKRLYQQLTSSYGEGFSDSEAQYAIEHVKADWNYNALQNAKYYQTSMNMSKSRIYQQLTSAYGENFTASEAQYAIDHLED